MTVRLVYESVVIELNKIHAPVLKLYEFNHLGNKAINLIINKIYNIYDTSLLTTDDLRILVSSIEYEQPISDDGNYKLKLPVDYLHLLNCLCKINNKRNCNTTDVIPATRVTLDAWSLIILDVYNKPSFINPYYYIHNDECEIRCGKPNNDFKLESVIINYIKIPNEIHLTKDLLDQVEDTSENMEFPDYINQEIINELVHLVMEKINDPRLGNHVLITLSIARPTQQLQTN